MPESKKLVYYSGCEKFKEVSAADPVEVGMEDFFEIWGDRLGEGSFAGINLEGGFILQLREEEDGSIYTEILDTESLDIQWVQLDDVQVEELVYTIFKGRSLDEYLAEKAYSWTRENLKQR